MEIRLDTDSVNFFGQILAQHSLGILAKSNNHDAEVVVHIRRTMRLSMLHAIRVRGWTKKDTYDACFRWTEVGARARVGPPRDGPFPHDWYREPDGSICGRTKTSVPAQISPDGHS
ncbi:predicted protein [Coccidioides posadasii str. Silveira]|uniref:Predicted protein n=1 Tax=Coccidioides posadasii (strain RMSCC 757 / Silveira) TaxID=443226 RepID=E9DGC7_COCPS|nr:predicted protein [Coccidioides posadasii str. Silveira]